MCFQLSALSLLEGKRKTFEELSSVNVEPESSSVSSSENSSDEASALDSPWEISDEDDEIEHETPRERIHNGDSSTETEATTGSANHYESRILLARKPTMEMPHLLDSIGHIISCLYKMPLRRPAPLDRLAKEAAFEVSLYQHFDSLYVRDKFPKSESNLAVRLGKMISRRRQLLRYRSSHHQALETESLEIVGNTSKPANLLEHLNPQPRLAQEAVANPSTHSQVPSSRRTLLTKATTLPGNMPTVEGQGALYAPSLLESKSSVASTYAGKLKVEIPPRPRGLNGQELESFECPYCYVACHIRSKHSWK